MQFGRNHSRQREVVFSIDSFDHTRRSPTKPTDHVEGKSFVLGLRIVLVSFLPLLRDAILSAFPMTLFV
jgi:hypothetical protein